MNTIISENQKQEMQDAANIYHMDTGMSPALTTITYNSSLLNSIIYDYYMW